MAKLTRIENYARFYLAAVSAVTLGIAVTIFCAPDLVPNLFFADNNESTNFFVLFLASTLVGYSVLNYLYSSAPFSEQRKIATVNLSTLLIATVLSIYGAFTIIDTNAWIIIGQHGLFAAGFLPIVLAKK